MMPQLPLAVASLDRLDVVVRVRVWWHVKANRIKLMILPGQSPKLNVALGFKVLCCFVPAGVAQRLAPHVLELLYGKHFDIDLNEAEEDGEGMEIDEDEEDEAEDEARAS